MTLPRRAALLAAITAVLLVALVCRARLGAAGHPRPASELERLEARRRELDRLTQILLDEIEAKQRVTDDVIGGRLTLLEAAARFRAADAHRPPAIRPRLDLAFPGASCDERRCRQVIEYAREELWEEPDRRDAVVARLEAELQHLRQHGRVQLPPAR